MKKEECLRILKEMSTQKDVPGGISNRMYSDLRRKSPWHFLMFAWKNKSEKVIEVHKRVLIEQYQAKVEILLKCELTQEDVDDLELINESVAKTGRLMTVDTGFKTLGIGAEIVSQVISTNFNQLKSAPIRLGLPDHPIPSSVGYIDGLYVDASIIFKEITNAA